MNVGSLFSGIGGLDLGLHRAGHEHAFFCESDPWRREVLAARWPGIPVFADVRTLGEPAWGVATDERGASVDFGRWEAGTGLLCGGFPCQDLSVAGKRAGLGGDRSGLFFEFARIIESVRPGWILVENVPGLLSSNGGRDFGIVLGTLADLGYGMAWRILDSRFFGVPQRRRRVFIVGALAHPDTRAAAERAGQVLAVGQGCERHLASRGQAWPDVAGTLGGGAGERGWPQDTERMTFLPVANTMKSQRGRNGGGIGPEETLVAAPLVSRSSRGNAQGNSPGFNADDVVVAAPLTKGSATGEGVNQPGRRQEDDVNLVAVAGPLGGGNDGIRRRSEDDPNLVTAFDWQAGAPQSDNDQSGGKGRKWIVRAGDYTGAIGETRRDAVGGESVGVRRLTPIECERLQGFPDGWTQLGGTPDSRRYSALGDAVTVNVAEWIGHQLLAHIQSGVAA